MGIWDKFTKTIDRLASPLTEEQAYRIVSQELVDKNIDQGLWTKALAQCNFVEGEARAIYVKERVAALHRAACDESERERARNKAIEENADANFKSREYELALAGYCLRFQNKNDPHAAHMLGWMAQSGLGMDSPSTDAAIDFYKWAIDKGRYETALALCDLYFRLRQFEHAYEWAEFALAKNVEGAKEKRKQIAPYVGFKLSWWNS